LVLGCWLKPSGELVVLNRRELFLLG